MEPKNQITPIEYYGQRILTTRLLAEFYETDEKQIRNNFSRNQERYSLKKHYFYLDGDELKAFKHSTSNCGAVEEKANSLYLWIERGALLHAKSLNSDRAWEVYEYLVETYFRAKTIAALHPPYETTKAVSIGEVTNLMKVLVNGLQKQSVPANKVAEQIQLTCGQFGIRIIPDYAIQSPYEQLQLENGR